MDANHNQAWYQDLDISLEGRPIGIDPVEHMLPAWKCYNIISNNGIVERVDVYESGKKVRYKEFFYDNSGRVVENRMYSPDGRGGWHIVNDTWYYEYDAATGLRGKKITRIPGASTAREVIYDTEGNRISERTIAVRE